MKTRSGGRKSAPTPAEIGERKYDETAASMIALMKYGCGLPFNRIEGLEKDLGIPLPAATQWEVVHEAAGHLTSAHEELIRQAAQGEVLHNDDTTMKILDIERAPASIDPNAANERRGIFTSGVRLRPGDTSLEESSPRHRRHKKGDGENQPVPERSPPTD